MQLSRYDLEQKWNGAAAKAHASGITIVNDVDNEEIPELPFNFKWLEKKYKR
jgi:hypothetical protein